MYDVLLIANYIIYYCNNNSLPINNLRLQKLLYFIQAEFLIVIKKPCFLEEIEAWDIGPVIPKVYYYFYKYGSCNIFYYNKKNIQYITKKDKNIINNIINIYSKIFNSELVKITQHQTPWMKVYNYYKTNIINKKSIKFFFEQKITKKEVEE